MTSFFAQNGKTELDKIAESEMKSASGLMNLAINPNTLNYDVTYHKLEFTVDPAVYFITGKVTTTYKALANISTVTFDLTNVLTVSSVKRGTTNLVFVQNSNNELVITLPSVQANGTFETLEINYSGAPATGEQAFTAGTHSGTPGIYTLSEPFGARDWWPCKQDLNDKVDSIDVYITAPSEYVSVSNGIEVSQNIIGATKTTRFHHGYAIPAYLIAIAVTNYQVFTQTAGISPNTFPIVNYLYPENFATAQIQVAQTLPVMNIYETLFETYPFHNEKYGHAQFGWGGGMEHTTVSFMGGFSRGLIAHELAHQWFGDKITCGSWKDIWLNEGFATYLASLAIENLDGIPAFVSDKTNMVNSITSSPSGAIYLTDTQATNVGRIFDSRLSYNKGAMVLEMLRFKMGDTQFFQGMRNYLADTNLAYRYAVTTNFQSHMEAVYGSSLLEFFNDWVYRQGYPTYTISAQNFGSGQAKIIVNQTQSHFSVTYFEMPLPIRLIGSGGQTHDVVVNNITNGEQFIVSVPFVVTGLQFDPEKHLISKNNTTTLSNENFELEQAISLYPNPSTNEVHIQLPSNVLINTVTLFNSLGKKVLEKNSLDFSVSSLSSGLYFVQIETSEGTFHKKIIKK